jgi:hypothetical protein
MLLWLLGDDRLIGRWRSDRERTFAEWRFKPDTPEEAREKVRGFLGKLELTYSRWRCESLFNGVRGSGWYRVLAKDSESAMIVSLGHSEVIGWDRTLLHIHFEGDYYWITLGRSNNREFFRRVR